MTHTEQKIKPTTLSSTDQQIEELKRLEKEATRYNILEREAEYVGVMEDPAKAVQVFARLAALAKAMAPALPLLDQLKRERDEWQSAAEMREHNEADLQARIAEMEANFEREVAKELSATQAELTRVSEALEWQPIETGPKDGTEVLLFSSYVYPGDKEPTTFHALGGWDVQLGCWVTDEGSHSDGCFTHWKRLDRPALATPGGTGKKIAKPGMSTYCDDACTPEKCSEGHERRNAVFLIDNDD